MTEPEVSLRIAMKYISIVLLALIVIFANGCQSATMKASEDITAPEQFSLRDETAGKELSEKYPGVDGFMIGRGVFKNPYCFTTHEPTREELQNLFLYHLDLFDIRAKELASRDSRYPYEPIKHFIKIYFTSFDGASELRQKLMECKSTSELRKILEQ